MASIAAELDDIRIAAPELASGNDRSFFGHHPKGLAYLAFTEAWERFPSTACRHCCCST